MFGKFTRDKRLLEQQRLSEARRADASKTSSDSIKIIKNPRQGGQSNSIAVIQENYGGLISADSESMQNALKQTQPKSEQKFRSQTNEAINRNANILNKELNQTLATDPNSKPGTRGKNTANLSVKQKAVRQFLEQSLAQKKLSISNN